MGNVRKLAEITHHKHSHEIKRALEFGLEAAPSANDRTISTFSRGHQPAFAGINTFLKGPFVEGIHEIGCHQVAVVGAPFDMGTTYRPGTRSGPPAIRRISALYDSCSVDLAVDLQPELDLVDAGGVFTWSGSARRALGVPLFPAEMRRPGWVQRAFPS